MDAHERQARNEALLRDVNERIERLSEAPGGVERFELHCECGAEPFCGEFVSMTIAEYELVREQDDRFVVTPGHENPRIERVVERTERFVVVDKLDRYERFVADDPRGRPSS